MSNEFARNQARAEISILAKLGAQITHYTGDGGQIDAVGYIDQEQDYAGLDGQTVATRDVVSLLVEEVGSPRRGDHVTDEDGVVWTLIDRVPSSDPLVIDWTVQRR